MACGRHFVSFVRVGVDCVWCFGFVIVFPLSFFKRKRNKKKRGNERVTGVALPDSYVGDSQKR